MLVIPINRGEDRIITVTVFDPSLRDPTKTVEEDVAARISLAGATVRFVQVDNAVDAKVPTYEIKKTSAGGEVTIRADQTVGSQDRGKVDIDYTRLDSNNAASSDPDVSGSPLPVGLKDCEANVITAGGAFKLAKRFQIRLKPELDDGA